MLYSSTHMATVDVNGLACPTIDAPLNQWEEGIYVTTITVPVCTLVLYFYLLFRLSCTKCEIKLTVQCSVLTSDVVRLSVANIVV